MLCLCLGSSSSAGDGKLHGKSRASAARSAGSCQSHNSPSDQLIPFAQHHRDSRGLTLPRLILTLRSLETRLQGSVLRKGDIGELHQNFELACCFFPFFPFLYHRWCLGMLSTFRAGSSSLLGLTRASTRLPATTITSQVRGGHQGEPRRPYPDTSANTRQFFKMAPAQKRKFSGKSYKSEDGMQDTIYTQTLH